MVESIQTYGQSESNRQMFQKVSNA